MSSLKTARRDIDGIVLLDKPLGVSSNRALQQVRNLFRANKAGHTGSLDPLATGMLPICLGEATKLCGLLLDSDKTYEATLTLGQRTSTGDAEGEVVATSDPQGLDLAAFEAVRPRFLGLIEQIPPMYSALKHQGQRLYQLARAGEEVERQPRAVTIHRLELLSLIDGRLSISVSCSKGTYIRTLAEDLASAVGQCAHLSALRRTEVSPFNQMRMWSMDELEQIDGDQLKATLLPLATATRSWLEVRLPAEPLSRLGKGQTFQLDPEGAAGREKITGQVAVLDEQGVLKAIAELDADQRLIPRRWLGGRSFA
ncbi:MAG: tRNA pseudouridine(55) synthase TruB [Panacagrimonas sp.]